jgi:hypothetical protein
MPIDWKGLIKFASQIPVVRNAIGATLEQVEKNPEYVKFVSRYQAMNAGAAARGGVTKAECMICMFHAYGVQNDLNSYAAPPPHPCVDRNGETYP